MRRGEAGQSSERARPTCRRGDEGEGAARVDAAGAFRAGAEASRREHLRGEFASGAEGQGRRWISPRPLVRIAGMRSEDQGGDWRDEPVPAIQSEAGKGLLRHLRTGVARPDGLRQGVLKRPTLIFAEQVAFASEALEVGLNLLESLLHRSGLPGERRFVPRFIRAEHHRADFVPGYSPIDAKDEDCLIFRIQASPQPPQLRFLIRFQRGERQRPAGHLLLGIVGSIRQWHRFTEVWFASLALPGGSRQGVAPGSKAALPPETRKSGP